jgi:hypothetical protein
MKRFLFAVILVIILSMQTFLSAQQQSGKRVAIVEMTLPEINIINNVLYIKNVRIGTKSQIFSIVGNKIREIEMKSEDGVYELNLAKGIYIFKLEGIVRKFVIK